ncbi:MAG: coenzyme F420-0:L-glutamate ligase [Dehalococcoidia bacterium]
MSEPGKLEVIPVAGMPQVHAGHDLAELIWGCSTAAGVPVQARDVVVVAQKIVSKSEGAVVDLAAVTPCAEAIRVAGECDKDPRMVEVVLSQSVRIVRIATGVLIVETHHGFVCANGGVDASNMDADNLITLLPEDPDRSAKRIRDGILALAGEQVAVIISDSFNRPWREGSINVAIGVAGMHPLKDLRGLPDDRGRALTSTIVALADELASAAQLVMGERGRVPAALVRGVQYQESDVGWAPLKRDPARDLFR